MITKIKASYYHSPRDGMTHVDLYAINKVVVDKEEGPIDEVSCWAGHLCMTSAQWSAFGGLLHIGDQHSTACELEIEQAYVWEGEK